MAESVCPRCGYGLRKGVAYSKARSEGCSGWEVRATEAVAGAECGEDAQGSAAVHEGVPVTLTSAERTRRWRRRHPERFKEYHRQYMRDYMRKRRAEKA